MLYELIIIFKYFRVVCLKQNRQPSMQMWMNVNVSYWRHQFHCKANPNVRIAFFGIFCLFIYVKIEIKSHTVTCVCSDTYTSRNLSSSFMKSRGSSWYGIFTAGIGTIPPLIETYEAYSLSSIESPPKTKAYQKIWKENVKKTNKFQENVIIFFKIMDVPVWQPKHPK